MFHLPKEICKTTAAAPHQVLRFEVSHLPFFPSLIGVVGELQGNWKLLKKGLIPPSEIHRSITSLFK